MSNRDYANQNPLSVGDEIELFINSYDLGKFKVKAVLPSQVYVCDKWVSNQWQSGHEFSAERGFTWFLVGSKKINQVAMWLNGCVCARCNARNQWAEPNRADGKYICFECR